MSAPGARGAAQDGRTRWSDDCYLAAETARNGRACRFARGQSAQFRRPQVYQPATRVAEPLLAIETSDFDRCLQLAGASHARAAAGVYGAGPGGYLNSQARFCCRFAADAARRNRRYNS